MKMKLILPILAAALLVGCRTTNDVIADYNANIAAGRYAQAAKEPAERAAEPDVDRLLWHLMSARASDLAGDAASAIAAYDAAEDVMDENGRRSVFAQGADTASAMLVNDKFFPYDGGGQDRIFTCLYKAVSYAAGGRPDAARTEFNRAATHQENWLYERNKDIAAAQENLDRAAAEALYEQAGGIKTAIVMHETGATRQLAEAALNDCGGYVRAAIESIGQ